MPDKAAIRVGDLISISRAPAVVSLSDVERVRDDLCAGRDAAAELTALVGHYCLADPETRAAFEAMTASLARPEERGDAFHIQGVYGAGKSHLLAVLALLCGHPKEVWPSFLDTHREYESCARAFPRQRLVVAIPLDEYPAPTHPLEHIVLSRIEAELAQRHGVRVALTEESHLLDLVDRYVLPQLRDDLEEAAKAAEGIGWRALRAQTPTRAAEVALEFLDRVKFPLDWRRSRAEAWGELRRELSAHGIDGPVILLDELGTFLAGKDRRGLNADASFLQYLAQRAPAERCWLICVTQRGIEEVGDVDRRTLRQLRDRFRPGFTLHLADLEWVVEHKVVRRTDRTAFERVIERLVNHYSRAGSEEPFSAAELARSYPVNPLCLQAIRRAAEVCLSRTRSAVRLLQEAAGERGWLEQPADRLMTPDVAFDLFRDEMALSVSGRRHLHAYEAVMANAGRIAPGREQQLAVVMKALCVLGLGDLRWPEHEVRSSLVGCQEPELWQSAEALSALLQALYRRGSYVERVRREGEAADEYHVEVSSDVSERVRQRLSELVREFTPGDSRVASAALEACREAAFPLAALADRRSLAVTWLNARRYVHVVCRDLCDLSLAELENLAGALESPLSKEDAHLFVASPTADRDRQEEAWLSLGREIEGRFAVGLAAWLPGELSDAEIEHLIEHTALASMVADRTLAGRRDRELREKVRERWSDSEAEARSVLQRAYYGGRIIGTDGREVVERDRLWGLFGDWEETLAATFAGPFRLLFPRFASIAPDRRLAGRAHTNQIIDRFIRPGEVTLPPASTLEAHLVTLAQPLGLVEGEDRHLRLALKKGELVEAALAAAPARSGGDEIDPNETISYGELAGRLGKSEWGLTREQSELLLAALIRTGRLVALDAFLQPVRLDAIAAPLGDNLPYVIRGLPLRGATADEARVLWEAALGNTAAQWDLPTQERAWGELIAWAAHLSDDREDSRAATARAAETLAHRAEDWAWAEQARARAEALAGKIDGSLTSKQGLTRLVQAAERMPNGAAETAKMLADWRKCELFLRDELGQLAQLRRALTDTRLHLPERSLLARDHRSVLDRFALPQGLLAEAAAVKAAARRWLDSYRRHYLAWHSRVHAAARFERLLEVRKSAVVEAARRLARAGLQTEEVAVIEAELARSLARRCLAGDPLPGGKVVCAICGVRLGEEVELPDPQQLTKRAAEALAKQREELRGHADLLRRRLGALRDERMRDIVGKLVADSGELPPEELIALLHEEVIAWLRRQIGQPRARRRQLRKLGEMLRGKELTKREVVKIIEEWLGAGEDEVIEIV